MNLVVTAILITMPVVMAFGQCKEVPRSYTYPSAPRELFHEEPVELTRLAGEIRLDLSNAELGGVLVELMDDQWLSRKKACLADGRGRFSLKLAPGLYYARFSKPGFATVRIPVRIVKSGRSQMAVSMSPA